jgi:lysophospholipase L1-like esterase
MPLDSQSRNNPSDKTTIHLSDRARVTFLGDSITELSGYPNHTKHTIGDNYIVGNFGACGTTISLDSENSYFHSQAFIQAKEFKPTIAVVMLGTNDAKPNCEDSTSHFAADYIALLDELKSLMSKPKIWVVRPPHIFDEAWLSGRVLSMNILPAIDEAAKQANLPLIDVYSAMDKPELFFDGVHPNDVGAKIIADVICQAITKT